MFRRQPEAEFTILKRSPTGTITENNQVVTSGDETRQPQAFNKLKNKITKIRPLSYLPNTSSRSSSPSSSNRSNIHKKSSSASSIVLNQNESENDLLKPSQEILDILAMVDPTNEKLTGVSRLSQYFTSDATKQSNNATDFELSSIDNSDDSTDHHHSSHHLLPKSETLSDPTISTVESRDTRCSSQIPLNSASSSCPPLSSSSKSPPLNYISDQEPKKSLLASSIMSSFGQPFSSSPQQQQQTPLQKLDASALNNNASFTHPSFSTKDCPKSTGTNYDSIQLQINSNECAIDDDNEYDSDDSFTIGDERRLSVLSSDMSPEERRKMIFSHSQTNNSTLSPLSPTFSTHSSAFQSPISHSVSQFDSNRNSVNYYSQQIENSDANLLERISSYESKVVPLSVSKNNSRVNSATNSRTNSFSKPANQGNFNLSDVKAAVDSLLSETQQSPNMPQYPHDPQSQTAPTLILPSDHRHSVYPDDLIQQYDLELDQQRKQRHVIPSLEISSVEGENSFQNPYHNLQQDYSYKPEIQSSHPFPKEDKVTTNFSAPISQHHEQQSSTPVPLQTSFVEQNQPRKSIEEQFAKSLGTYKPIISQESQASFEPNSFQNPNSFVNPRVNLHYSQPQISDPTNQQAQPQVHQVPTVQYQPGQPLIKKEQTPVRRANRELEEPSPSQKLTLTKTQVELNQWEQEAETLALHIPSETSLSPATPHHHKRISRFKIFTGRHRSHSDAGSTKSLTPTEPRSPVPLSPGLASPSLGNHRDSYFNKQPEEVARNMAVTFSKSTDEQVQQAIDLHEAGKLEESANLFENLGDPNGINHPLAQVLLGLSYRHGWGVPVDEEMAFKYLRLAASNSALVDKIAATGAVAGIKGSASNKSKKGIAKGELVLSIYELGNCFRYGWGTEKDPESALKYFETAARLGDVDAMTDTAWCYMNGFGIKKKNKYMAAKYYRMAERAGKVEVGNSWVWKEKYDDDKQKK